MQSRYHNFVCWQDIQRTSLNLNYTSVYIAYSDVMNPQKELISTWTILALLFFLNIYIYINFIHTTNVVRLYNCINLWVLGMSIKYNIPTILKKDRHFYNTHQTIRRRDCMKTRLPYSAKCTLRENLVFCNWWILCLLHHHYLFFFTVFIIKKNLFHSIFIEIHLHMLYCFLQYLISSSSNVN